MKTIIFDLDQTLINRTETVKKFLNVQHEQFGSQLSCDKASFVETVMRHQKNGYEDKLVAYENSINELSLSVDAQELLTDFKENYGCDGVLFPGIKGMLAQISEHYVLALVSNGRSKGQNAKIDSVGIREFFKVIKISEEEGVSKPNKEIYLRCLADLDSPAEECVFIGDHPKSDIAGPHSLGMKTVWVKSEHYEEPPEADLVVDSATEILSHLKSELFL